MSKTVETVYIATHAGSNNVYHTDDDCHKLGRADYSRDVALAEVAGKYRECRVCAGEVGKPPGTSNRDECPRCGEDISGTELPRHLPCETTKNGEANE